MTKAAFILWMPLTLCQVTPSRKRPENSSTSGGLAGWKVKVHRSQFCRAIRMRSPGQSTKISSMWLHNRKRQHQSVTHFWKSWHFNLLRWPYFGSVCQDFRNQTQPWALGLERSDIFVADNRLSTCSWAQLRQHLAEASANCDMILNVCTASYSFPGIFLRVPRFFSTLTYHVVTPMTNHDMTWCTKTIYIYIYILGHA